MFHTWVNNRRQKKKSTKKRAPVDLKEKQEEKEAEKDKKRELRAIIRIYVGEKKQKIVAVEGLLALTQESLE